MSVLKGPGEGTWSVFAEKVVHERDRAIARVAELERHRNELQELATAQITKIRELALENEQLRDRVEFVKSEAIRIAQDGAKDYADMRRFQEKFIAADERLRAMELAQAEVDKVYAALEKQNRKLKEALKEIWSHTSYAVPIQSVWRLVYEIARKAVEEK